MVKKKPLTGSSIIFLTLAFLSASLQAGRSTKNTTINKSVSVEKKSHKNKPRRKKPITITKSASQRGLTHEQQHIFNQVLSMHRTARNQLAPKENMIRQKVKEIISIDNFNPHHVWEIEDIEKLKHLSNAMLKAQGLGD